MKKTIKTMLAFVAGALCLAGCAKEEVFEANGPKLVTLTAYQEGDDATKAAIDGSDSKKIDWTSGDQINYFGGATGESMTLKTGAGTTSATFEGSVTTGSADYVLYPYQSTATCTAEGVITAEVPMTQYAVANSFDPAAALMVGQVNGTSVQFKNVMSYVKVTIPSDMANCKQVSLKAKDAWTTVAGKVNITASTGAWAETTNKEGQAFVRLVPTSPATTLTAGASYYIAILPQTMATGFELIFNDNDVIKVKQSASSSVEFGRSKTKKLGDITSFTYTVGTVTAITFTMADRNIGAAETTAYGDYFAWAALRPAYTEKTTPTWYWSGGFIAANTPYYSGSSYTKYKNEGDILEAADDIAAMLWGGNWRMPTYAEWDANKANASVKGLPLAGGGLDTSFGQFGERGFYWSATLSDWDGGGRAGQLQCNGSSASAYWYETRYSGLPVRPVLAVSTPTPAATDLSASGTANCYIVSGAGTYKFQTVQGNSANSVGAVASAAVLWESFGTSTAPTAGDLISGVSYADNYITFSASALKGNAVIAAKDASGENILWSWHIWLTDAPADQVYNGSAGTMMDRNLGATSAEPGEVQALGLLYQWGRKDPFLGSSSISEGAATRSTGAWSVVQAQYHLSDNNTLTYSIGHPMTYLTNNTGSCDWYCTSSSYSNDGLWSSTKTIYDPCPVGYRVPDGGNTGIWAKALGTYMNLTSSFDTTNYGIDFGKTDKQLVGTGSDQCWYPAAGSLETSNGVLSSLGAAGYYWACTPFGTGAYGFNFNNSGRIVPKIQSIRGDGFSVRCCKQ